MDPLFLTILVGGGIFLVSFMLGRLSVNIESIYEIGQRDTIFWLCDNGYVYHRYTESGDLHLETLEYGESDWAEQNSAEEAD
jgi:phage antirepressor YoqD-like protein